MSLRDFLVKASLEPDFRELVRTDPEAAFADFDLTDEQKAALLDPQSAGTLVARESIGASKPADAEAEPPPPPSQPNPTFALRVFPTVNRAGDGTVYIAYDAVVDGALTQARHIPWQHRLGLPETTAAAQAVHDAPDDARRDAILALIDTLVRP